MTDAPACRARSAASTRASTSSGWQGFVTQSSAPSRRPRTRWATEVGPVQTTTTWLGEMRADAAEVGPRLRAQHRESITIACWRMAADLFRRRRAAEHLRAPADGADALGEHADEAAVRVDDRQPRGRGAG